MHVEETRYGDQGQYHGVVHTKAAGSQRPGVLVLPDAWGLTPFARRKAARFADAGYVAMAGDLYGQGHVCANLDEAGERANTLGADPAQMLERAQAGMQALADRSDVDPNRIAVVGYCLGGAVALHAARRGVRCAAVVSYHGLLKTRQRAAPGGVRTRVLVCTGADDPLAPLADVSALQEEMTAARADCQIVQYTGAGHSFTREDAAVRPGFGYHADADRRSWRLTTQLLEEAFA